jgi:hypothetical protein
MRKPILLAALGAMLVLAIVLGGGTQHTRAFVAPGIQDFDLDMVHCLLPSYPPDNLSPDPMAGPYQVCAAGEDKGLGTAAALSTGVGIIEGNRLGYPYVYSGPGWVMKADTPADYGTKVGDVASLTDLFENGVVDVTGDASNCGGPPNNCGTPLDLTTAIPEPYIERTINWGATTGCTSEDESYLTQAMPGATAMTKYVRYRACIDTLFLNGYIRFPLNPPTPLNLVTLTPNWSPAGTHVNLVLLSGAANSPTTLLQGIDSPLASISHTLAPYTDNPPTPGLYVRWMTELSAQDEGDGALSFVYTTNCKAIGGSFTDADADCLASVGGANPAPVGQPVDPDDTNPDIDGDGLLDGVEVAWGSGPMWTQLGITVTSDPPADCDDTGTWTLSSTAGINPRDILDVGDGAGNWESVKVETVDTGTITVQRCVDRTGPKDIQPGWFVMNNNAGVQGELLATITDAGGISDTATQVNLSDVTKIQKGDLLKFEDSTREIVKVESDNPVANPVTIQRAVAGTTAQIWPHDTKVYRFITDRMLPDMDGDGRTDLEEMIGPTQLLTDPTKADTDGDTVLDGGYKVDLYDTPSTGCQTSGNPDGKPDFPDENGDSICDSGMSANQDPLNGITDGSSHVRVGFAVIKEIPLDGLDWDNCPSTPNADQKNTDFDSVGSGGTGLGNGDLYGDACDGDDDNDEMADGAELTNGYNAVTGQCTNDGSAVTNPLNPDSDGDTVLDGVECFLGKNPASAASKPAPATSGDADKDGLTSGFETYQRSQNFSDQRAPRPVGNEDVDLDQGGSGSACDLAGNCGGNDFDSDNDGLWDSCEAIHTGTSLLRADTDGDTVLDRDEPNASSTVGFTEIGNGASIATPDVTVPSSAYPFDCDNDADNDGKPDADDADPAPGQPVDVTYDDDGDGMSCIPTGGGDPTDTGPSWDANCNAKLDGKEASCPLATNPTGDDDGDGLLNTWEVCKWGTNPNIVDSDGDGKGDCIEACDTDGNGLCGFGDDALNSARATLLPAGTGTGKFGKDGDFDLNGNNLLSGDFGNDTIRTAQYAFKILACK